MNKAVHDVIDRVKNTRHEMGVGDDTFKFYEVANLVDYVEELETKLKENEYLFNKLTGELL